MSPDSQQRSFDSHEADDANALDLTAAYESVLRRSLEASMSSPPDSPAARGGSVAAASGSGRQQQPNPRGKWAIRRSLDMIAANLRNEESGESSSDGRRTLKQKSLSRRSLDGLMTIASSLRDEEEESVSYSHRSSLLGTSVSNFGESEGLDSMMASQASFQVPLQGLGEGDSHSHQHQHQHHHTHHEPIAIEQRGRHRLRVRRSLSHISSSLEELISESVYDKSAAMAAEVAAAAAAELAEAETSATPVVEFNMDDYGTDGEGLSGTSHFINMINKNVGGNTDGASVSSEKSGAARMVKSSSAGALSIASSALNAEVAGGDNPNLPSERQRSRRGTGLRRKKSGLRLSLDLISMALEQESLLASESPANQGADDEGGNTQEDQFAATRQRLELGAARASRDMESVRKEIKAAGGVTSGMALEVLCAMAKADRQIGGGEQEGAVDESQESQA